MSVNTFSKRTEIDLRSIDPTWWALDHGRDMYKCMRQLAYSTAANLRASNQIQTVSR